MITRFRKLLFDTNGVAMIEFAFIGPIILLLGLVGIEMANLATTHMRISQAAMHVADNASRIGNRDQLAAQRIFESDINDVFVGVDLQAGEGIGLLQNGRVVISSLEQNAEGGQTIKWQRCMGLKEVQSEYGPEGTGATGTDFPGMGRAGKELKAAPGQAVMFVEVIYDYQPILDNSFTQPYISPPEIRATAAFTVRGSRDLSGIFQRAPADPVAVCSQYKAEP